jgi:hypothetical protein
MVQPRWLALGGGLVAAAETIGGVCVLLLLGSPRFALFLLTCAIATAVVTAATFALVARPGGGPGAPPDNGPSGGGPPDEPEPPPWWPAFERELREHMSHQERSAV